MALFPDNLNIAEIEKNWLPTLDKSLGLKLTSVENDTLTAELEIGEDLMQPFGRMHGGVSCVLGESLGSIAAGIALKDRTKTVVGQNLYALHLRPVVTGMTLVAEAKPQHVGRRSQIWDVMLKDKATQKPTAKITLTLAVIDLD